tara:strand:+ start:10179 stop:11231 length:1053 start_codon:yes stop_codon:yes gene_type:complete
MKHTAENSSPVTEAPTASNDNHKVSKEVLARRHDMRMRQEREEERVSYERVRVETRRLGGYQFDKEISEPFADDELPVTIPAAKASARAWLDQMCVGVPVTVCAPKVRKNKPKPVKLARAANDNQAPQSWHLAETLRRENLVEAIEVCEVYRGLWSVMAADPLQGKDANLDAKEGEARVEHESSLDGHKKGETVPDEVVGTGELTYHGVRRLARAPGDTHKAARKGENDAGNRYQATTARFNEDTLIAQIDLRETWHRMRSAIRPLLWAFELACLDDATMTEIGKVRGYTDKRASAVGKALVLEAIAELQSEWRCIRDEQRAAERQTETNVIAYRARLAAREAEYLGRAA